MRNRQPVIIIIFLLISIFFYHAANAQAAKRSKADSAQTARAQNIYVELGGPGLFFSANYDTRFSQQRNGFGGRIGMGFISTDGASILTIPVQLNYLLGKDGKYFEMGLGATYASFHNGTDFLSFNTTPSTNNTVLGTMTFGYRYQPVEGGFNFRASFNPLFNSSNFVPFFGISFGYSF